MTIIFEALVGRLRGEQSGRENNSSRLPVCHEPNQRLTSKFVVGKIVWMNSSEGVGAEEFGFSVSVAGVVFQGSVWPYPAGVLSFKTVGARGDSKARRRPV